MSEERVKENPQHEQTSLGEDGEEKIFVATERKRSSMTRRQFLRCLAFFILAGALIAGFNTVMRIPKDEDMSQTTERFRALYTEEENTWDGIFLGTSLVSRGWVSLSAWEKYGMTIYPMSTDGQPFVLTKYLIEEVLKYQDLSFVVVDLHGLREGVLKTNGSRIRNITDHMRWSKNRTEAIAKALEWTDQYYPGRIDSSWVNRLSYYFPLLQFHSRLTEEGLYLEDVIWPESEMKGVYDLERTTVIDQEVELKPYTESAELTEMQTDLLEEFFDYTEEKGIEVVFVKMPSALEDEVQGVLNALSEYVEDRGYPVLNFNDPEVLEESGIDGTDLMDTKHLNAKGARAFSDYFSDYLYEILGETSEVEDHRGEDGYESWDEALENYEIFYAGTLETMREKYPDVPI